MKHIDTLAKYEECLATGMSDKQARLHVKSWAEAYDMSREDLATKSDLRILETEINSKIDRLDGKMNYMYLLGAGIFAVCCIPILQKLFS